MILLGGFAVLKTLVGLLSWVAGLFAGTVGVFEKTSVWAAQGATFGVVGLILLGGGRRDSRARTLALFFLVVASVFAGGFIRPDTASRALAPILGLVRRLQVDGFMPLLLWLFVRDFPERSYSRRVSGIARLAVRASASVGILLFLVNVSVVGIGFLSSLRAIPAVQAILRAPQGSYYFVILFGLLIPALPFALWKAQSARPEDRRRLVLFTSGLVAGLLPMAMMSIVWDLFSIFAKGLNGGNYALVSFTVDHLALLSIPFTTAYSVRVNRVLDVRLIVRKALQYALARLTVIGVTVVPLVALVASLYIHRHETLAAVFASPGPFFLIAASAAGLVAVFYRDRLLMAIDRRFFRERLSANRILAELAERSRATANAIELSALLTSEVDRALHLDTIALLTLDPLTGSYVAPDGAVRPLPAASPLLSLVAQASGPLEVDLVGVHTPFASLPEENRLWLADGGFQLLVPFHASDGSLTALLALGEKKSELPFDAEDRLLLSAIAASGALALENRLLRSSSAGRSGPRPSSSPATVDGETPAPEALARECPLCRRLFPSMAAECAACRRALVPAVVPYVLAGKFRFDKRIGSGGMGVVYRAVDMALGRNVAIKTLPKISPENALRLRREARAAAAVQHPNLAMIYGAETWRGTPVLVFEYLEGGTLADRLDRARLSPSEAVTLGISLAGALERAHAAGVLHRDIKPSNIGYTHDGTPKLLDFGLARLVHDTRREGTGGITSATSETERTTTRLRPLTIGLRTATDFVVGTPSYLSPEAVVGDPPDPTFDLWSLAIVLYEAVAGRNPVGNGPAVETMQRIRAGRLPDPALLIPACPPAFASFLKAALARDKSRRPASATVLRRALEDTALACAA